MMRSTGLVLRLARRNLLRRPGQAVLLLVTLTVATFTLGTALAMQGLSDGGWKRLWLATDGPHVTFISFQTTGGPGDARLADLRGRAVEMAGSPEVAAVGGPWNHLLGHLQVPGGQEDVTVEVRDPGRSPVDQPLVTDGHWLRPSGGVVLERSLADALDLGAGDTVTFSGGRFPIVGVARSVSAGTFPLNRPGQVWVDPETAAVMRDQGMGDDGFVLELRLDDRSAPPPSRRPMPIWPRPIPTRPSCPCWRPGRRVRRGRTPRSTSSPPRCTGPGPCSPSWPWRPPRFSWPIAWPRRPARSAR